MRTIRLVTTMHGEGDKLPVKMLWDFGIKFHLQTDKTKPIVCYRVETSISAN